jgi:hypothetical protein
MTMKWTYQSSADATVLLEYPDPQIRQTLSGESKNPQGTGQDSLPMTLVLQGSTLSNESDTRPRLHG